MITIGGALSLSEGDKYYGLGLMIDRSLRLFVEYVNKEKGGIRVGSRRLGVRLVVVEDASSSTQVTNATANALRSPAGPADFAWGPYSSGLNQYAVRQSYADGKLTVNSGSSKSSVYALNNLTFGVLPSSTTYLNPVFATLKQAALANGVDVTTFKLGCIGDNSGHMAQCAQVPGLASAVGIDVDTASYNLLTTRVGNPPTQQEVNAALSRYKEAGVNVLISTGYNATQWVVVQGMMSLGYTPLAAVCTISYIPTWPGEYLFHPSPWAATRPVRGKWSGLTSIEFAERFETRYGADAQLTYQGAGAFGGVSALAASIEAAGVLDTHAVARKMYTMRFDEFYGNFTFSAAGQAQFPFLMLQHTHSAGANEIVYPPTEVVGGTSMEFPMPTWAQRFCRALGPGSTYNDYLAASGSAGTPECSGHGTCNAAGQCECTGGHTGAACAVAPGGATPSAGVAPPSAAPTTGEPVPYRGAFFTVLVLFLVTLVALILVCCDKYGCCQTNSGQTQMLVSCASLSLLVPSLLARLPTATHKCNSHQSLVQEMTPAVGGSKRLVSVHNVQASSI